jgi:hypothetical protein
MRSRRAIAYALAAWVVVLFAAGGVWRAVHPEQPPPEPEQTRFVESRQAGYNLCLRLPANAPARHDVDARKRLIAQRLPAADRTAALRGCYLAQRR